MLRSRGPITSISSSILCCIVLVSASVDDAATKAVNDQELKTQKEVSLEISSSQDPQGIEAGSTPSLICKLSEPGRVWWTANGQNLTTIKDSELGGRLDIRKASRNDTGEYICMAQTAKGLYLQKSINIRVIEPGKVDTAESTSARVETAATLTCHFNGYPLSNFSWSKNDDDNNEHLTDLTSIANVSENHVVLTLEFKSLTRKDNGTYECRAYDYNGPVSGYRHLFVIDVPQVNIDFIKAVGAGSIYLNWTVNDGNKPIKKYFIRHMKNGTNQWQYYPEQIGGGNLSYVLKGFEKSTAYQIGIRATNEIGDSHSGISPQWIRTLDKDPVFVPTVHVNGVTVNSITIAWAPPPPDLQEHVHYYNLMATYGDQKRETVYLAQTRELYAFPDLDPATTYKFKISACSEYTRKCGNWSKEVNGTTLDGAASAPQNLSVTCRFDNISNTGFVSVTWAPPARPNGVITRYEIELHGIAHYRNDMGRLDIDRWTRQGGNVKPELFGKTFDKVPSNTNYTARIYAMTRQRTPGKDSTGNCTMPVTIPDKDSLNMRTWRKVESEGKHFFKLYLPRISERNGPICCYRIFMVKLAQQSTVADLPSPEKIDVYSYRYAHASESSAAYIAEAFDSDRLVSEIILGDGESVNASSACDRCIGLRPRALPPSLNLVPEMPVSTFVNNGTVPTGATAATPTTMPVPLSTIATTMMDTTTAATGTTTTAGTVLPSQPGSSGPFTATMTTTTFETPTTVNDEAATGSAARRRREDASVPNMVPVEELSPYTPQDGFLAEGYNYTGFIEVIVFGQGEGQLLAAYSSYFNPLFGGFDSDDTVVEELTMFSVIMQISIVLILVIVILLIALCVLHRYTKRAQQRGEEIITLRNSFRHLCRSLRGRHQLVTVSPPDMTPIQKSDLLQSYIERHRDSDYGFQQEFELLPDRFADRTTRASEARENLYKNRYPDIKCYDQTRVRLAQIDGICGSDYINANFVLGYKERKKFICAQGPMENTVCDYWRMIWEQHLELVLMLTNLEEYSKTKCAKYWPDKGETNSFGDITVEHVRERPYSDYVVRELKMTRTGERDSRTIIQYHFLVWKDFIAPEHPHAILRFIKRVNEAYSLEKGPILVHCSAGVGRTGTLVALDSLLQQLAEEGQVSIFNTVCDLRHQRNFLVQSLKQYIFIYRALMEMAQYGDTEIPVHQLKETVERLRQRDNGKEKCRMEEEYDRISSVLEDRKSFSVGGGDENRLKNRSELVIPYDRNRVILTPVPGREHSTYINASFIEGYDNSESFVITQDPLDTTIADFWRMILEQCVSTIVMLSDLNDGPRKCPRYWPDDESVYDHVKVRYIQSESCPYYTRRELCVSNTKTDESVVVTQYQYHGWPTVEGEVPEVTRGLIELVDQTLAPDNETSGPLIVHCNCGSDRSSMFVALSILIQQLRTEKRVDIFTTTKKLRSQRHGMINSFAQYEFLHRAIVNYSDLHNLADEEPVS